jgi:hypothetical protein
MALDVFQEDPSGADLAHDPFDLGPQVPGAVFAAASPGLAEGLAGITGRDDMNAAAPRSAVKGSQIVPYRRRSQGLVFHPGHESGRRMGFPLDVTHSAISGLGDMQAEVEPAVAGAERKSSQVREGVFGMKSHKARSLLCRSLGDRFGARGPQDVQGRTAPALDFDDAGEGAGFGLEQQRRAAGAANRLARDGENLCSHVRLNPSEPLPVRPVAGRRGRAPPDVLRSCSRRLGCGKHPAPASFENEGGP